MAVSLTDARSAQLYRRALEYLPGGVNSPVRAMRAIGRDPLFIDRGQGSEIMDVDGNRYVDWVMSWGPLIHGHAHPEILEAVIAAAERGTTLRRADPGRDRARRGGRHAHALGGDAAHDVVGHRGDDERLAARPRGHRPGQDPEVRRRVPRPRRRSAGGGGLGPGHAGHPRFAGRARGRDPGHGHRALERPRRAAGGHGRARARRDHRGAIPGQHGRRPLQRRLPRAAARAGRRQRRAAHLRRGHLRLPRGDRRRPGSVRGPAPT